MCVSISIGNAPIKTNVKTIDILPKLFYKFLWTKRSSHFFYFLGSVRCFGYGYIYDTITNYIKAPTKIIS